MDEKSIHDRITALVEQEHALRSALGRGEIARDDEHAQLAALEQELDQCWDLLRQRDARRAAGADPEEAAPRPVREVEGYIQ